MKRSNYIENKDSHMIQIFCFLWLRDQYPTLTTWPTIETTQLWLRDLHVTNTQLWLRDLHVTNTQLWQRDTQGY